MIAVPCPSPLGILPARLLRNSSSSCSLDIFRNGLESLIVVLGLAHEANRQSIRTRNLAGSLAVAVRIGVIIERSAQRDGLERFQILDQRVLVGIGQVSSEI